jgi:hypothetical protein
MKLTSILTLAAVFACVQVSSADCSESSGAVARLCQAVKERKQMVVDNQQPEIIWSDGAMFEVASRFPGPVQELISTAKSHRDLKPIIARMKAGLGPEWKAATVTRSSGGDTHRTVKSSDGTLSVRVASAYMDYLRERYPNAQLRIKDELQPVLFLAGDTVRAAVMPVRSASK